MTLPTTHLLWQRSIQKLFLPRHLVASNQGWTLIEMAVVAVIAGILAVVATPSMLGSMRKSELQATANQVKGALREAQRAAIRNGSSCTVIINPTTATASVTVSGSSVSVSAKTISGSPAGCVTSPVTLSSTVNLLNPSNTTQTLSSTSTVSFSYKGNPDNPSDLTLVLGATGVTEQRCIVVSTGIGIMRSGTYSGTTCTSTL